MRAVAEFLRANRQKPVLLVVHSRADADAVAAAAALSEYLPDSKICVPDSMGSSGKRIRDRFSLEVACFNELKFSPEAIVILDTDSCALLPGMCGYLSDFKGRTAVIDHHSLHQDAVKGDAVFIDNRASSTSEIIYEFFRELNFPLSSRAAEMLLAGVIADSADFRTVSTRTLEVVAYLLKRTPATLAQVAEMVEGVPDANYRVAVIKSLSRTHVTRVGDFVFATSEANTHEAVSAERLVALGADYAFVAQVTRHELRISGRCRTSLVPAYKADVAAIMKEVGGFIGGSGGGHAAAAGANGPDVAKVTDALALAERLAREQLKKAGVARITERF